MAWRLGGDLGTNSLGWCAIKLDAQGAPVGILAMGSRIFSDGRDPKSKQSLAVDRREAPCVADATATSNAKPRC